MIIIIEGADGTGKTTLAKHLSTVMNMDIMHMSQPDNNEQDAMFKMYENILLERDNIIFDRCWYSELVYGPIMRNNCQLNDEQISRLEGLLKEKGYMIIHCNESELVSWHRATERGETYVTTFMTYLAIYEAFACQMKAAKNRGMMVFEYSAD